MIHFFRRIRQKLITEGLLSKYLIYALGEILLVVIGILLALQINNWNEERKANLAQKDLIADLREDLQLDLRGYDYNLERARSLTEAYAQYYEIGVNKREVQNIDQPEMIRGTMIINPVSRENDPNLAHKINNPQLRDLLLNYFKKIKFAIGNNETLIKLVEEEMRAYVRKIGAHNVDSRFKNQLSHDASAIRLDRIEEYASSEEFQQLLFEASLKTNGLILDLQELKQQCEALIEKVEEILGED